MSSARIKSQIAQVYVLLMIALSSIVSCTKNQQHTLSQQNSRTGAIENSRTQKETELERSRRIWQESKITNYRIMLESAIADPLYTPLSPVEIEVRDGRAVSIKHSVEGEKHIPIEAARDNFGLMLYESRGINTIEGMFELIKRAEEGKASNGPRTIRLKAEYDPKLGYPTKVEIDRAATDSQISFHVRRFEVIE